MPKSIKIKLKLCLHQNNKAQQNNDELGTLDILIYLKVRLYGWVQGDSREKDLSVVVV